MAKGITIPIVYKSNLKGLDSAQRALVGFEQKTSMLNRVIGTGMVVAAGAATAAVGGLAFAVTRGFDRLQQIEQATFMLKGLGHEAEAIETIMDSALDSVKGTAFGLGDAATIAAQAVAAGVEPGEKLTRTLSVLADTAAITNRPLGEIQRIMGKVITTSKAQRVELLQLADRGLPIFQMLADELGVTEGAIMEMASAGEISADILIDALENKIGGAAKKMGDSTSGAMANTLAAIQRVGANLIGPIYDQFGEFFRAAIEGLAPIEESAKGVGDAIGTFLNPKLDEMVEFVRNLSVPLQTMQTVFVQVKDGAGEIRGQLDPLITSFLNLRTNAEPLLPIISMVADFFSKLALVLIPFLLTVMGQLSESLLPSLMESFETLAPKLIDVATIFLEDMLPVILDLALMAIPLLTSVIEILTPIIEFFANVLVGGEGGLLKLITGVWLGVAAMKALNTVFVFGRGVAMGMTLATYGVAGATYAQTAAQRIGLVMANLMNGSLIKNTALLIGQKVATVASKVATVANTAATWAATAATKAWSLALRMNPIGLVITAIAALIAGLVWFFTKTEAGQKAWEIFMDAMKTTIEAVSGFFVYVFTEWIPGVWGSFVEGLSSAWEWFSEGFMTVLGHIGDFFEGIINNWIGLFEGFINGIIGALNWVVRQVNKLKIDVPATPFNDAFTMGFNLPELADVTLPRVALAEGGIVTGPTNALIGEAGPEAVIPLNKSRGMGNTYNITVNAGLGSDGQRIGEQIIKEIKRYERQSGPVFARA